LTIVDAVRISLSDTKLLLEEAKTIYERNLKSCIKKFPDQSMHKKEK